LLLYSALLHISAVYISHNQAKFTFLNVRILQVVVLKKVSSFGC